MAFCGKIFYFLKCNFDFLSQFIINNPLHECSLNLAPPFHDCCSLQGTSVPSTSNPILPQQQTQQRLQQEPRVRTPEEKQARLEKILRFLQSASPEQQQQLFMKLRATPEQQQHLLARAEALKTQKQQQQLQVCMYLNVCDVFLYHNTSTGQQVV